MNTETQETSLAVIIRESGLEQTKAQVLLEKFTTYFDIAADWERKAQVLTITDASQVAEMKMAREGRLFLRQKRIDVENTRKTLKADALREGQTIDAIAKILTNLIAPIEEDLQKKEKFAELQEAARMEKLRADRTLEIQPYAEYAPSMDFGRLSEDEWAKMLNGARLQHEAAIEAERKAEADRIAKEKAESEERERIRMENERLRAEAEAREKEIEKQRKAEAAERAKLEAKAKADREAAEAKLKAEREKAEAEAKRIKAEADAKLKAEQDAARKAAEVAAAEKAKLEAAIKAKADEELKAREKAEAEAKKAAAAPDKKKLAAFAKSIADLTRPNVSSPEAQKIADDADALLDKVVAYIEDKAKAL